MYGQPQGQYPPQQGQYPPQQGQYPPQQGQYPPQQGQYPPQQGQYPPQGQFQQPMYGQPQGQPMMYQQQPMYAQPQGQPMYVQPPPQIKAVKGFERLETRDGIFIKQKKDFAEMLTGCEQENTYYVFPLGKDGDKKGKKIFKCKEKSSCMARQCLNGDCRPFQLKVNLEDDSEALDNEPFLLLDRPCAMTCCCFNRPELTVTHVEDGKNVYVGKIVEPWQCCDIVLEIMDKDNNCIYKIDGSCCQCGLICKCPCDSCQTVDFDIKLPSGDVVASIQKRSQGCVASMVSDADNFALNFPANCSKESKALLMAAVLFLDFRHFEEKQNNDNRGNLRGF